MNATDEGKTGNLVTRPGEVPAENVRQEFWLDTCREVTQMHIGSPQVLDLYRSFGCRFCVPTHEQVQHVLDALDGAVASWEKLYPRLFFETLELNFPELVRHG
jgi:hypothetical protein